MYSFCITRGCQVKRVGAEGQGVDTDTPVQYNRVNKNSSKLLMEYNYCIQHNAIPHSPTQFHFLLEKDLH